MRIILLPSSFLKKTSILFIVIVVMCSLWGCSTFKPGTLTRVEEIAVEDAVELVEDETRELEDDIQKPNSKSR